MKRYIDIVMTWCCIIVSHLSDERLLIFNALPDHCANILTCNHLCVSLLTLFLNFSDGDKLYKGLTQIIAHHLDTLAERDIVPTFPRTGIMMDTSTIGPAASGLANGNTTAINSKTEIGASGSGGSMDLAANESEAVEMALEGERFLRTIKLVWEDHIAIMKKMQLVLKYMVRAAYAVDTLLVVLTGMFIEPVGQSVHTIRQSPEYVFPRPPPIRTTCHPFPALPNRGKLDIRSSRPDTP
jgi:hypothetical protein